MDQNRKVKILHILGFSEKFVLEDFLVNIISNVSKEELHQKGVAKSEVKEILRKVNPDHQIFQQENFLKEESKEMVQFFVPSVE